MTSIHPDQRFVDMTNKHLANAARFGRRVTFLTPDLDEDLAGYVVGFDDDNVRIAVVTDQGGLDVKLRNRKYIAGIDEDKQWTMNMEDPHVHDQIETLVKGFRKWVMQEYFPERAARAREI